MLEVHRSNCNDKDDEHSASHESVDKLVRTYFEARSAFYNTKVNKKSNLLRMNQQMLDVIYSRLKVLLQRVDVPSQVEEEQRDTVWWLRVLTQAIGLSMHHTGMIMGDQHKEATCIFMATLLCLVDYTTSDIATPDPAQMLAYVNACRVALAYRYNDRMHTTPCKFFVLEKGICNEHTEREAINVLATVMVPQGMHANQIPGTREHVYVRLIQTIASSDPKFEFNSKHECQIMDELGVGRFSTEYMCSAETPDVFHKCLRCLRKKGLQLLEAKTKILRDCINEQKLAQFYEGRVETHVLTREIAEELSTQSLPEIKQVITNSRPCKRRRRSKQPDQKMIVSVDSRPALHAVAVPIVTEWDGTELQMPSIQATAPPNETSSMDFQIDFSDESFKVIELFGKEMCENNKTIADQGDVTNEVLSSGMVRNFNEILADQSDVTNEVLSSGMVRNLNEIPADQNLTNDTIPTLAQLPDVDSTEIDNLSSVLGDIAPCQLEEEILQFILP